MNRYKQIGFTLGFAGVFLLALFLLLGGVPQVAYAKPGDVFVMPDGDGDCSQASPCALRTALEAATEGDTIYVAQGTYTGSGGAVITVAKTITLYGGWDGAPAGSVVRDPDAYPTTLDGEDERRVIHLDGRAVAIAPTVDGFAIANGSAAHVSFNAGRGGGIHSTGATPLIAHNIVTHNVAGPSDTDGRAYGGGIYLNNPDGTAVITANVIISNAANVNGIGQGGGIYLSNAPAAQVANNVVLSNTGVVTGDSAGYGGGIAFSSSPDVLMEGNQIAHNVAYRGPGWQSSDGGGVYCYRSHDLTFRNNVVHRNTVNLNASGGTGGGMQLWSCYRAALAHNRFEGNASSGLNSGSGGGLYTYAARDLTLEANRFVGNRAYRGGGLYMGHNTAFTMTNSIVAENHGGHEGGGMAFEAWSTEPVSGTLLHNTFAANDQGSRKGRVAIHLSDPYVTLALTNNLIYSHTYGIYAVATSTARLDHTLFYANSDGDVGGQGVIVNVDPITAQDPLLDADYHLQYGSPAIDAGAILPRVDVDIDGEARPNGLGYDIGADEYSFHCTNHLTGVVISGPTSGVADLPYAFTARITPTDATPPITYTWSPEPHAGQSSAFSTYIWAVSGTKVITVTAENCGGSNTATHTVTIAGEPRRLFMPLVLKEVEGPSNS